MANQEYELRELPRTGARDVLDLIRQHAGIRQDGWVYPFEAELDGVRVECIGYGRPPEGDDWEDRPTTVLAVVVDDDLAGRITPITPVDVVDAEIVEEGS